MSSTEKFPGVSAAAAAPTPADVRAFFKHDKLDFSGRSFIKVSYAREELCGFTGTFCTVNS